LISVKAAGQTGADEGGSEQEPAVPQSAIPVVIAVIAFFAIFMGVIGSVSIWSNLPDRRPRV